jgi:hypothetical protein
LGSVATAVVIGVLIGVLTPLVQRTSDAQFVDSSNRFYGNYFARKSIQFAPGESDTLSIFVVTARQSCRFTFRLYVDYGAHQRVERLDNAGQPFTASAGLPFNRFREIYAGGNAPGTAPTSAKTL